MKIAEFEARDPNLKFVCCGDGIHFIIYNTRTIGECVCCGEIVVNTNTFLPVKLGREDLKASQSIIVFLDRASSNEIYFLSDFLFS